MIGLFKKCFINPDKIISYNNLVFIVNSAGFIYKTRKEYIDKYMQICNYTVYFYDILNDKIKFWR